MKTKNLLLCCFVMFTIFSYSYVKIDKHRDHLRFGYGFVEECLLYQVNSDGSKVVVGGDITCRMPGDLNCRVGAGNVAPPSNDLENLTNLTSAEKEVGNNMINIAEISIEASQSSGSNTQTITFMSTSGQSYYRTYSFTWITNADESIDSEFTISDPTNI